MSEEEKKPLFSFSSTLKPTTNSSTSSNPSAFSFGQTSNTTPAVNQGGFSNDSTAFKNTSSPFSFGAAANAGNNVASATSNSSQGNTSSQDQNITSGKNLFGSTASPFSFNTQGSSSAQFSGVAKPSLFGVSSTDSSTPQLTAPSLSFGASRNYSETENKSITTSGIGSLIQNTEESKTPINKPILAPKFTSTSSTTPLQTPPVTRGLFGNQNLKLSAADSTSGNTSESTKVPSLFDLTQPVEDKDKNVRFSTSDFSTDTQGAAPNSGFKLNSKPEANNSKDIENKTRVPFFFGNKDTNANDPLKQSAENKEDASKASGTTLDPPTTSSGDISAKNTSILKEDTNASKSTPSITVTDTTNFGSSANQANSRSIATSSESKPSEKKTEPTSGIKTTLTEPAPSQLKGKTMHEIVSKWASDLDKYQKKFLDQAEQVSKWDRILIDNGDKVSKLYVNTIEAERTQEHLDQSLLYIESHQNQLAAMLDQYEHHINEIYESQFMDSDSMQPADVEREQAYAIVSKLTEQLDSMEVKLSNMVNDLNKAGTGFSKLEQDSTFSNILQILNSHLATLSWIESSTTKLNEKVSDLKSINNPLSGPGRESRI